jgi:hypothetical protein
LPCYFGIEDLVVLAQEERSVFWFRLLSQLTDDALFHWERHVLRVDAANEFFTLSGQQVPPDIRSRIVSSKELPAAIRATLGINTKGRLLVASGPPTVDVLRAMLDILASDKDEAAERDAIAEQLKQYLLATIDQRDAADDVKVALFENICAVCPPGEEFLGIQRDAASNTSRPWIVFVPSYYRTLLAKQTLHGHTVTTIGYNAGDETLVRLLSFHRLLGGQTPIRWE